MLGGDSATWDQYFKVGREYTQKTGLPWYDAMGGLWGTMKSQMKESYVKKDGTIVATTDKMKKNFETLTATTDMSAHLTQWSDDWNAQFKSDKALPPSCVPHGWSTTSKAMQAPISRDGTSLMSLLVAVPTKVVPGL